MRIGPWMLHCGGAAQVLLLAACGTINQGPTTVAPRPSRSADEVASCMMGSYATSPAAAKDSANHPNVVLHISPMWEERMDGRWLYMEQAMADASTKPYWQRICRVMDQGQGIECMMYELPGDPMPYAGAWQDSKRLNQLLPSLLNPQVGCSVVLSQAKPGVWTGSTSGSDCDEPSHGAATISRTLTLTPTQLSMTDQGFDSAGKQVWGSADRPLVFIKGKNK